jgi:hypothetical protein
MLGFPRKHRMERIELELQRRGRSKIKKKASRGGIMGTYGGECEEEAF